MSTQQLQFLLTANDKATAKFKAVRAEMEAIGKSSALMSNTLGLIGPALVGAFSVTAITGFVRSTINGIDALNDLKDATGASIENLSALEDVAVRTGSTLETAGDAVIKLNKALNAAGDPKSDAAEALKALGLSVKELKALDPVLALQKVGQALLGFADNGAKGRIELVLLGKSTKQQAALLKDLAEQGKLNATVTTEQAEAAEKLNKEFFALQKNIIDAGRALAGPMVSAINQTIEKFREGTAGAKGFWETLLALSGTAGNAQLKMLGIGGVDQLQTMRLQEQRLTQEIESGNLSESRRAAYLKARADLQEKIAKLQPAPTDAKSAFLRGDKDTGPGARPSLPDVGGKGGDKSAAAKRVAEELRKLAEIAAKAEADVGEQSAQDTAEAWDYWGKIQLSHSQERADAMKLQWQQVFEAIDAEQEQAIDEGKTYLDALGDTGKKVGDELALVFSSAAGAAISNFKSLRDVLKGVLADIAQIALRETITKPLTEMISGALKGFSFASLGSAKGNAFGSSGLIPFASGGIVNSPTLFKFAGGAGLMGEAGPEAILPLQRGSDGKLGVKNSGSSRSVSLTYAPTINIDSRSDRAQVGAMVSSAVQQGQKQMLQHLKAQGVVA